MLLSTSLLTRALFGFLLALLLPNISLATSPEIEEVSVIATRVSTDIDALPARISTVAADSLELVNPVHIQQSLNQLPGVNVQRGNGQESLPSIRSAVLTGAGACGGLLVMEEAIPVRGAGFCNINELFDTHFEHATSIDVVRGANTAFFGSNALTGSINVSLAAQGPHTLSLEAGANSFLRLRGAASYGSPEQGDQSYGRIYATIGRDGGYRDEAGFDQRKLSWRQVSQVGEWSLSSGLTITNLDQQTAGFIVGLDSYLDRTQARQNLDPEAFRKTRALRTWVRANRALNDKQTLQLTPYLRLTDMDFLQFFLPGDPLEQNSQTGVGLQSSITTQVNSRLSWAVGFDVDLSQGELQQTQDQATRGSPFLQETIPSGTHYDYQVDAAQIGLFAHTDWQFSEHWRLVTGLRWEGLRYDYDNLSLTGRTRDDGTTCGFGGCRYSRPADRTDNFSHLSPKFELQYAPDERWRFHLSLADTFRAPQATELYRLQRQQTVADLDTVRATNADIGFRWQAGSTTLAASLYRIDQRNLIIRDSDFFNVDGAATRSTGLELSAKFEISSEWSANLTASYADHEYTSDRLSGGVNINGLQVDTAPKTYGAGTMTWQPTERFNAALEAQFVDEYFLEPENQRTYPGHTLFNLRSSYQFSDHFTASLRLLNLTDKRYAERADFTSFTQERYFPGEPRSAFVELKYQF